MSSRGGAPRSLEGCQRELKSQPLYSKPKPARLTSRLGFRAPPSSAANAFPVKMLGVPGLGLCSSQLRARATRWLLAGDLGWMGPLWLAWVGQSGQPHCSLSPGHSHSLQLTHSPTHTLNSSKIFAISKTLGGLTQESLLHRKPEFTKKNQNVMGQDTQGGGAACATSTPSPQGRHWEGDQGLPASIPNVVQENCWRVKMRERLASGTEYGACAGSPHAGRCL